jgi:aryl-alcohol dehydrogenase-like predicted oxidoreductase
MLDMVHTAFDNGITHFDLANNYGPVYGSAEENFGRILDKDMRPYRDEMVISTKAGYDMWPGPYGDHGSRKYLMASLDQSLKRLNLDYVDIFYHHRPDPDTPLEETMEALDALVKSGKVRAIGASAMYGYQFHNMQICAERNGLTLFSTLQNHYNLIYREDERELIPVAEQYGVSRIPYSPLAGGHLSHRGWESGTKRSDTDKTIRSKYDHAKENDLEIIGRVAELSDRLGVSMSQVALAWQFKRGVAAPIVGATNAKHFDDAVKAVDLTLSDEEAAFIEAPYKAHEIVGAISANMTL